MENGTHTSFFRTHTHCFSEHTPSFFQDPALSSPILAEDPALNSSILAEDPALSSSFFGRGPSTELSTDDEKHENQPPAPARSRPAPLLPWTLARLPATLALDDCSIQRKVNLTSKHRFPTAFRMSQDSQASGGSEVRPAPCSCPTNRQSIGLCLIPAAAPA